MCCLLLCTLCTAIEVDIVQNIEYPKHPRMYEMPFVTQQPFIVSIVSTKCWKSYSSFRNKFPLIRNAVHKATAIMMASVVQEKYQK